jgi:hypothetical protein
VPEDADERTNPKEGFQMGVVLEIRSDDDEDDEDDEDDCVEEVWFRVQFYKTTDDLPR